MFNLANQCYIFSKKSLTIRALRAQLSIWLFIVPRKAFQINYNKTSLLDQEGGNKKPMSFTSRNSI